MTHEDFPSSFAAEAASMDTSPERLAKLVKYPRLAPLVAANPSTNRETIQHLYESGDLEIKRILALNPSVPMEVLHKLAQTYPVEFLRNPLLPLLTLSNPRFVWKFPDLTWLNILRCEDVPAFWLQQLKEKSWHYHKGWNAQVLEPLQLHVSQMAEAPATWRQLVHIELRRYQHALPEGVGIDVASEEKLFLLCLLLFPQTVAMLKAQWKQFVMTTPSPNMQRVLDSYVTISERSLKALSNQRAALAVRAHVARHPGTPIRTLLKLSRDPEVVVRAAVAAHPRLPLERLHELVKDTEPAIRRRAVLHPGLSEQDLTDLALDSKAVVRAAIASRHHLPADLYTWLAGDAEEQVRQALARNVQTPAALLQQLAADPEPFVRAAAAAHPRLPQAAMAALLGDETEVVRCVLAGNASLPVEAAWKLVYDPAIGIKKALASNPRLPADLIEMLLKTEDRQIWSGLARNPRLSPVQLTYLARHGDLEVRQRVTAHKRTPVEVLRQLAQASMWRELASNPQTPLDVLTQIVETEDTDLWLRVFHHPVLEAQRQQPFADLLKRMLPPLLIENTVPCWFRRIFLQYASSLPINIIEVFANSPFWQDRYLLARHPHASPELLQVLAHDGIIYVRVAAQAALATMHIKEE